jgi:hypothetical protein
LKELLGSLTKGKTFPLNFEMIVYALILGIIVSSGAWCTSLE